jgi:hypothetical protein
VLRRSEGTCSSSRSDDEVGELNGAIRAQRAKRAEQSNRPGEVERIVEAGVPRSKNGSTDDPRYALVDGNDLGAGKGGDRDSMGDPFLDGVHQVGTQGTEIAAQDHSVRVDDAYHVIYRITQGRASALKDLQHRSLAFIDGLNDEPNCLLRLLVDQPSRFITGEQLADD